MYLREGAEVTSADSSGFSWKGPSSPLPGGVWETCLNRCETKFAMNEPGASCVFEGLTVVLDDSRTSLNSLTTILGSMMLLFWTTEVKKPNSMCLG